MNPTEAERVRRFVDAVLLGGLGVTELLVVLGRTDAAVFAVAFAASFMVFETALFVMVRR